MAKIIRTSKHPLKFANKNKKETLGLFLEQFQMATQEYINHLWNNQIEWKENRILDVQNEILDCPRQIDYKITAFETSLSARALSSAATQACGIVKAQTRKVSKLLWVVDKLENKEELTEKEQGTLARKQKELESARKNMKKPVLSSKDFKAEISSKNAMLYDSQNGHFDHWLSIGATGLFKGKIFFPIKNHRHTMVLERKGFEKMGSFLVSRGQVEIRWQKEVPSVEEGKTIGCDTGVNSMATFSNQEDSDEIRINGWTYSETVKNISRKRKGSRNFQKADSLRKNTIKGTMNHLVSLGLLDGVKQVNLENNSRLKFRRRTSRYLARHTYGDIKNKIQSICEEHGVRVQFSWSGYKSQRCSACGWTQKSNRKKKAFLCKKCGLSLDADLNAAKNNELDLPFMDFWKIHEGRLNLSGFYWRDEHGTEPRVPSSNQAEKP